MDSMSDVLSVFWIIGVFLVPLILIAVWLKGIIKPQRNTCKLEAIVSKGKLSKKEKTSISSRRIQ